MNLPLKQLVMDIMLDADLKARALAEPAAVLAERGIELPEGHTVHFLEDTATTTHIVLPAQGDAEGEPEPLEQHASKFIFIS